MYRPVWHPLSAVRLVEPPCSPSRRLIASLLASRGQLAVRYVGDRLWPAVRHGEEVEITSCSPETVAPGSVVLAWTEGRPDLYRLTSIRDSRGLFAADADPELRATAALTEILGVARGAQPRSHLRSALHRRWLDLREAWSACAEAAEDPAVSVQQKYDRQAKGYARSVAPEIEPRLEARLRGALPKPGAVLVVGSGAGRECLALASSSYRVTGIDFSSEMIGESRAAAQHHGLDVDFLLGDVRTHDFSSAVFDAALFTYDVYSFIPGRAARVQVLKRLRNALRPGSPVFLSVRLLRKTSHRAILALQHRRHRACAEPGDSHTRWLDSDDSVRRSYVHLFTLKRLGEEIREAGYRLEAWEGGHGLLRPL